MRVATILVMLAGVLSTVARPVAQQGTFNSCGDSSDLFQFSLLQVSPDPPKTGHELEVHVSGYLEETISQGSYALVQVKIGLIKLIDTKFDVCEELPKINMTCPIQPGEQDILRVADIPSQIPKVLPSTSIPFGINRWKG